MSQKVNNIIYGLYDDDDLLINGIKTLRSHGVQIYEVYTPFPIHGLPKALGMKKTRISNVAFLYGCFGFLLSCILTWYTMIYDWPQDIGGKPADSWLMNLPAFIPIIFELTIFCSAHFMCITYLIGSNLVPGTLPKNPDPRTTDDKFLVEIHESTNKIHALIKKLQKTGAIEITINEFSS